MEVDYEDGWTWPAVSLEGGGDFAALSPKALAAEGPADGCRQERSGRVEHQPIAAVGLAVEADALRNCAASGRGQRCHGRSQKRTVGGITSHAGSSPQPPGASVLYGRGLLPTRHFREESAISVA